jgi:hypothetical protein
MRVRGVGRREDRMAARTMHEGTREQPARRMGRVAAEQAREQVEDRIALEKGGVVQKVMGVAGALRATAEQLDAYEQGALAVYAQRAAEVAERLADSIERKTFSEIVSDVERASRERPIVAGALAMAVGFAAARLARSTIDGDEAGGAPADRARRGRRAGQGPSRRREQEDE